MDWAESQKLSTAGTAAESYSKVMLESASLV